MNQLKLLRVRAGLTQDELAKRVNVDQTAVSRWEKGKNIPLKKWIPALARALDVTEAELEEVREHYAENIAGG